MSNFLRGGQVTAHKFRMTMQVIKTMMQISLCIMGFTIFMTLKNNITPHELKMVPPILKKYVFQDMNPEAVITYRNAWGKEVQERVRYARWSKDFISVENKFVWVFWQCVKRIVWVIGGSLIFAMFYFYFRGYVLQSNKRLRGAFLLSEKDLRRSIGKHNRKFKDFIPHSIAGVPYAATGKKDAYTPGEQSHTLVLGSTGSGKTKVIQELVQQLDIRKEKAIIVDIKGDYIASFYNKARGDIILNPLDVRGANWNFFCETDGLRGFETIARTLIPDSKGDMFWSQATRTIFCELATYYKDKVSNLAEFVQIIAKSNNKDLEKILSNTSAAKLVNQDADKTVACVLMNLSTYLSPLKLYNKTGDVFSISDWVNNKNSSFLFISTSSDMRGQLNALIQMQVDLAINALCSSRNLSKQQTWFILDEIAFFDQGLPNLKDGLATSRSFGGAFVLGAQDMSSLSKVYGQELSRVIANNCRNKLIMNVDDSYTSKWCSDLFGEGELEEWHEGLSYGAHEMRDGISSNKTQRLKKVILPSEFAQLKTGSGYIKVPGFNPALIHFKDVYIEQKVEGFIEDISRKESEVEEENRNVQSNSRTEVNSNKAEVEDIPQPSNDTPARPTDLKEESIKESAQKHIPVF